MFTLAPTKTNNSPRIEWKSSIPASFKCSLDNGPYVTCGTSQTLNTKGFWMGTNLREGSHTLVIKAIDVNGNEVKPKRHSWLVGKIKFCDMYC